MGKPYSIICFKNFNNNCSMLKTEVWSLGVFQIKEKDSREKKLNSNVGSSFSIDKIVLQRSVSTI